MPILKRNGKTFSGTPTKVDTAKSYTTFDSADDKNPTTWSDVELLTSKEEQQSLFSKISTMFKNIRYLYKILGTTDISHYSDGTATGAIKAACDKADANEAAIADVNNKLGNTDISAIGDGTLTGGLDALNSNLNTNFIWLGLPNAQTNAWGNLKINITEHYIPIAVITSTNYVGVLYQQTSYEWYIHFMTDNQDHTIASNITFNYVSILCVRDPNYL